MGMNISKECADFLQGLRSLAKEMSHEYMLPEHLLLSLCGVPAIAEMLRVLGADVGRIRGELDRFFEERVEKTEVEEVAFSLSVMRIFSNAEQQVLSSGRECLEISDLMVALFSEEQSYAVYVLHGQDIYYEGVIDYVTDITHPELKEGGEEPDFGKDSALDLYAVDLNRMAEEGKIDFIVGREKELHSILRTLSRRKKNNPLLAGEPGVGKTAIVEGLAVRIVKKKVPPKFRKIKIYALDMGALTAGTKFRGQFEERLKQLVRELAQIPEAVLFIDEIHTVIGAGSVGAGSLDASNILKPSLNNGTLRCIGATTHEEYRNHILKDKAFSRRFLKIDVPEPSPEDTLKILEGIAPVYEKHYGVKYEKKALNRAVELASRHIFDRFMPDKAIDLMDEAGAANSMLPSPQKKITSEYLESLAVEMFGLPQTQVSGDDASRLKALEETLQHTVIGQDHAIRAVVQSIKISRAGLGNRNKPVGSFLFAGPTGVGKTELARRLAESLGIELVRFDMSEYAEEYAVSKLIGSSPGYVGFEQGGLLTEQIIRKPHCVLLLDEMEKAHAKIYDLMLQIMDYGAMTDNSGRKADFRNVIVIMTSNVGAKSLSEHAIGFAPAADTDSRVDAAVKKHFSPEFRNRLDGIVHFNPLSRESIRLIVGKFLRETSEALREKKVKLLVDEKATDWLAENGFNEKLGARPMERLIRDAITAKIVDDILFGKLKHGGTVRISADSSGLRIR